MSREVLLVEDDESYRLSVKLLFRDEHYRFVEASSPEEGIAKLAANPQIRVILLDLSFEDSPGTVVLDHIKEHSADYRVIVLTGHDELLAAERAGKYEVFDYLPKAEMSSTQAIRFSLDQAFKDLERKYLDEKNRFLLDVQKRISHNQPMKETLDLICQAVRSIVGAYTCHLRVYDFNYGDYHLEGFAAVEPKLRKAFELPKAKGDDFSGRVVESGMPEVFDDLQNMQEFRPFASRALQRPDVSPEAETYFREIRSAYIVPISTGLFGNAVDAVLNVSSDSLRFFSPEKCVLVDEFVNQAALAITKDWLQRKREEMRRDYSDISGMLGEITDRLSGADALRGIYDVVTRRISEIVNPEVVSIFRFNEATRLIENVAELRGNIPNESPDEFYEAGQGLPGAVFEREATILLPKPGDEGRMKPLVYPEFDHQGKEEYLNKTIPSGRLDHYLGVPIKMGIRKYGVLRAINKKSRYYQEESARENRLCLLDRGFSVDCKNIIEITARHLAVTIRSAELLTEKDRQVNQVRTLSEVGRLINSALDTEEVLTLTIHKMREVMQAEICMLFLREEEDRLVLKQCSGMPMITDAFYRLGEGATGRVAEKGEPRLVVRADLNDGKYDQEISKFLTEKYGEPTPIESLMIVPIVAKGTILGAMKVINKQGGDHLEYSQSDLHLFETFADYVSVAIQNAQIYKDLSLLVSAVAHEINNTAGVIPASVHGIRARLGAPNEKIEKMLARIENAASQATEFANEIAGFSAKYTRGKRPIDINIVIKQAIETLDLPRYKVPEAITLNLQLGDSPLVCEIYERPFAQIVRNILLNALQALDGRQGGVVEISSWRGDGELRGTAIIRFEDNGPGIKPEHMSRIFDSDFTTKTRGNGLGLWLVRTQLRLIGGTIEVKSESGLFARFAVKLPLSSYEERA